MNLLLRRVTVNGQPATDIRVVVKDGVAVLVGRDNGVVQVVETLTAADAELRVDGLLVVTGTDAAGAEQVWTGQKDTRCGSCGGRYELRAFDVKPYFQTTHAR